MKGVSSLIPKQGLLFIASWGWGEGACFSKWIPWTLGGSRVGGGLLPADEEEDQAPHLAFLTHPREMLRFPMGPRLPSSFAGLGGSGARLALWCLSVIPHYCPDDFLLLRQQAFAAYFVCVVGMSACWALKLRVWDEEAEENPEPVGPAWLQSCSPEVCLFSPLSRVSYVFFLQSLGLSPTCQVEQG